MEIKSTLINKSGHALDVIYRESDPALDYKKYFDWGIIGDHIMKRALELEERV